MDFAMSEYDPNRIQFAIIKTNNAEQECYGGSIYNEHIEGIRTTFDTKLSQYSLPYDIIKRPDNIHIRINGALQSYNAPALKKLLKGIDKKIITEVIHAYMGNELLASIISSSITESMSFDMLDAFYDNGMALTSLTDSSMTNVIIRDIMNCMVAHSRNSDYKIPTPQQIDRFFKKECDNIDETFYIGTYVALKRIIIMEKGCKKPNNLYRRLTGIILMTRRQGDVFEELLMDIASQLNFSDSHDTIHAWICYACLHGSENMKEYAKKNVLIYSFPKRTWDSLINANDTVNGRNRPQYQIHTEDLGYLPTDEPEADFADDFEFMDDEDEDFIDEDGQEVMQEAEAF